MYCLSVYLIQIHSYRAFSNMAVDHWCLSLKESEFPARTTHTLGVVSCYHFLSLTVECFVQQLKPHRHPTEKVASS